MLTAELLDEALRMRRAPGIAFVDGAAGRRAVVAGTALEVWEIVQTWKDVGGDEGELSRAFPWLQPMQLRAALGYFELFPEEIEARLAREAAWTPERVWDELPYARPPAAKTP